MNRINGQPARNHMTPMGGISTVSAAPSPAVTREQHIAALQAEINYLEAERDSDIVDATGATVALSLGTAGAHPADKFSRIMTSAVIISLVLIVLIVVVKNAMPAPSLRDGASIANSLKLVAKPWNDGYVHVWADLTEGPDVDAQYKDIHEGTVCTKLDNESHVLGSGDTAIYYFKVNCSGTIGFVEVDQAR
jgi:hypothetical protein